MHSPSGGLLFYNIDLSDDAAMRHLFETHSFSLVINLAAQAGVRYSIDHPHTYIKSNIDGFLNILEGCRHSGVPRLIYASSSSVYGSNTKVPFCESDPVDHPVSLYAATKKSNELMAHVYSHLYGFETIGLRFFTVYGPWGRPDMSPFLFMDAILHDRPIKVFNNGDMYRDFTYIDDIIESISRLIHTPLHSQDSPSPTSRACSAGSPRRRKESVPSQEEASTVHSAPCTMHSVFNIGNSSPVRLLDYILTIEQLAGKEAIKEMLPMQPGDVYQTYADTSALEAITGFRPQTPLAEGLAKTLSWFRTYYHL